MATLKDELGLYHNDISDLSPKVISHYDKQVVKSFTMGGNETSTNCWLSWQEFGTHKHVKNWWLTEDGYAVGFNENPSHGWSFPIVKLKAEMFEKAKNHNKNYFQYYNLI